MDFTERLNEQERTLFDALRSKLKVLGSDVVEQVRMHRVVYSRGFSFRDFCEVTLKQRKLVLTLISPYTQGGVAGSIPIMSNDDIGKALPLVRDAYERV